MTDLVTAGLERRVDFWDVSEADFDAVLNVNLKGLFFITQAFVKNRIAAGSGNKNAGGKIINIFLSRILLPRPAKAA